MRRWRLEIASTTIRNLPTQVSGEADDGRLRVLVATNLFGNTADCAPTWLRDQIHNSPYAVVGQICKFVLQLRNVSHHSHWSSVNGH
jgi:hypothetical protein